MYAIRSYYDSVTQTVNNLASGTYSVTVTDSWGCDEMASVTIIEPSVLTVDINSVSYPLCNGDINGSAFVSATGGTSPYSYIWDDTNNSSTALLNNIGAGTYNVTVTDNYGCSGTAGVTLTQPDEMVAAIGSSVNVSCNGENSGSASVSVSGGTAPYEYIWDDSAHTPLATANHLEAGTYHVTVRITSYNVCYTKLLRRSWRPYYTI